MRSRAPHTAHVQTDVFSSQGVVRRDFSTETADAHVEYYIAGYVRLINSVNMLFLFDLKVSRTMSLD